MAQFSLEDLPASSFTDSTIRRMYKLVLAAKCDPSFQKIVRDVVNASMRGVWKAYAREVETWYRWVQRNVDYRRDPNGVEVIQDWVATLDRKCGDCDDFSILIAAGCEALGAPTRFVTVSTSPTKEPGHVYVQVLVDGRWQGLDGIVKGAGLGWEPQNITAKKIWDPRVLGLSGFDEKLGDLGMDNQSMPEAWVYDNYNASRSGMIRRGGVNWEGGFADHMMVVNPTGARNDISKTFAPGIPGDQVDPGRIIPSNLIIDSGDQYKTAAAGGGTYGESYPIIPQPSISERRSTVKPEDVPFILNPDTWTGSVPEAVMEPGYMDPQPFVSESDYIRDLAGLGIDVRRVADAATRKALYAEYCRCVKRCRDDYRAKLKAAGLQGLSPEQGGPVAMLAPSRGGYKPYTPLAGLGGWFDTIVLPSASMDPQGATAVISASIANYAEMFFPAGTPDFIKMPAISAATDSLVKRWVDQHNKWLQSQIQFGPISVSKPVAAAAVGTGALVAGAAVLFLLSQKKGR